uniref:DDE_3 domain-containing protein n=3 Tax=Caenorhabditis japonica TaxID=281687 RepID=A0A8R1ET46_CAEJA
MVRPFGKKTFTVDVRKSIVRGHELGAHPKILATQFGCSSSQIYRMLKNNHDDDGVVHRQAQERPRTTSRAMDRNILRVCREDPRRTSTDIQLSVTSSNEPVPLRRTIRRRLQVAGLHGRRPVKKPLICSSVPMSGGITWRWICDVWGCFSDPSMGQLKRIVGTMDRYVYEDILENTMRPWAKANLSRPWVFQQDNDPKHTSSHVANWFRRRRVDLLEWPSQSPDLNPIEHMWKELERRLKGVRASNANQKFAQLEAAWKSVPMTVVQTLLDLMPGCY